VSDVDNDHPTGTVVRRTGRALAVGSMAVASLGLALVLTPRVGLPHGPSRLPAVSDAAATTSTDFEAAFQTNTGEPWTVGSAGDSSFRLGMASGTNPAIGVLPTGYEVAFQANTGALWTVGNDGNSDWGLGMAAKTSPSLATVAGGGFEVAFQANTGALWTVGNAGNRDWGLGLRPGTSPSISGLSGGGFEVAFQANTGALWTVGNAGNLDWGLGLRPGTSPAVTGLAGGGFETAFQANIGSLWTVGNAGNLDWGLGLAAGTSPSIAALAGGGFEVAFQANTGALWTVGNAGNRNWGLGLAPGTSPSIGGPIQAATAPPSPLSIATPGTFGPTASGVLTGKVVAVDPGHNGDNYLDPSYINALIWNGREAEACDTTGTETDSGYTEAEFNFNVATDLMADLRAEGATVVLTRTNNTSVGPCVTERAAIGNEVQANAAVAIHADGGPVDGRGYAILEPVADGINNAVIAPSAVLGNDLRNAFGPVTGEPVSSYDGVDGIQPRDDLAGINLTTVPKVFIECANMRNPTDAALTTNPAWQALAARGIAAGITTFLT